VRVEFLGGGLYGYVSDSGAHAGFVGDNPHTPWNEGDAAASCMVLNSNFGGFPSPPLPSLQSTVAHEFNHSIQYGYGGLSGANGPDQNFIEGCATWMEDEVFDASNDNYNFLDFTGPTFSSCMGQHTGDEYAYWITFRGLTERYGVGVAGGGEQVMQDFWEITAQNPNSDLMLDALNQALVNKGTNLADAFHAYAITVKFNRTCGGGYVYPYCFKEGAAYVAAKGPTQVHGTIATVNAAFTGSVQDNYAVGWVALPLGGGPYPVSLRNNSPSGGQLRASLVCDTGLTLLVTPLPAVAGPGATTSLPAYSPTGCLSAVAVITNQSQTAPNPGFCVGRSYTLTVGASPSPTPTSTATPTPTPGGPPATPTPTPIRSFHPIWAT
jgi:hypothetical protein